MSFPRSFKEWVKSYYAPMKAPSRVTSPSHRSPLSRFPMDSSWYPWRSASFGPDSPRELVDQFQRGLAAYHLILPGSHGYVRGPYDKEATYRIASEGSPRAIAGTYPGSKGMF